jgi:uncharacterized DUF497 family protein
MDLKDQQVDLDFQVPRVILDWPMGSDKDRKENLAKEEFLAHRVVLVSLDTLDRKDFKGLLDSRCRQAQLGLLARKELWVLVFKDRKVLRVIQV